jgi:hypothetical protein
LNGGGNFTMTAFTYSKGGVQTQNASGTYSISPSCAISLTFTNNGSTSSVTGLPSFTGLLTETNGGSGLITLQNSGSTLSTGTIIAQ